MHYARKIVIQKMLSVRVGVTVMVMDKVRVRLGLGLGLTKNESHSFLKMIVVHLKTYCFVCLHVIGLNVVLTA